MRRDLITWAGYLSLAIFTFFLNIQGNILPFLRDAFGLGYRMVTLHPAAVAMGLILCGLFADRAITALGRRRAIAVGLVGLAAGAGLVIVAPSPVVSIAGCLLMGLIGGLILACVPSLLVDRHGADASAAIGEANGICYAASLLATLSTGLFVMIGLGWRSSLLLGIVLVVASLVAFRSHPLPDPVRSDAVVGGRLPAAYWFHWSALVGFVGFEQSILVWTPTVLESLKGLERSTAAMGAGLFSAGMLIGRMSAVPLLARVAPERVIDRSLLLVFPAFLLFWGVPTPALCLVGLFCLGLGTALLYPLILAGAIGLAGPLGTTASARASQASGLAVLTVPLLVGALADRFGLSIALIALPVLAALATGLLLIGRRRLPVPPGSAG
jgi:fucose permease